MLVRRHGVSRSATVILAWLMASESKSVTAAMAQLASVRPQCRPNPGFWRQLNLFQVTFLHDYNYTYTTICGLVLIPCPVAEYGLPSGARQCPLYLLLPAARLLPAVPGPLALAWARLQVLPLPSCSRGPVTGQLDSLTHYKLTIIMYVHCVRCWSTARACPRTGAPPWRPAPPPPRDVGGACS